MLQRIFWITPPAKFVPYPGRLAIMPRPRGGEWLADEIAQWRGIGIAAVLSLLMADEVTELGLTDEAALCRDAGISFLSFPIVDMSVPTSIAATRATAGGVAERLRQGERVAIHCRGGIGRSSLMAASIFIALGGDAASAFAAIGAARGVTVPETDEQRQWVTRFAKERSVGSGP